MSSCFLSFFWIYVVIVFSLYGESYLDYRSFDSIDDVIKYESICITNTSINLPEEMSEAYTNRGESFFLKGDLHGAFSDFQSAYIFGTQVNDVPTANQLAFRSLFGLALVYGCLDMPKEVEDISKILLHIIYATKCKDNPSKDSKSSFLFSSTGYSNSANVPIYGPDRIQVDDCISMINKTIEYCKFLISCSPSSSRGTLIFVIEQLGKEGRDCCRSGGLWKACFQPLANKYHMRNQKWKVFGIPPDPAWD